MTCSDTSGDSELTGLQSDPPRLFAVCNGISRLVESILESFKISSEKAYLPSAVSQARAPKATGNLSNDPPRQKEVLRDFCRLRRPERIQDRESLDIQAVRRRNTIPLKIPTSFFCANQRIPLR